MMGCPERAYDLKASEMFQRQGFFTSGFDKIAPFTDYIGAEHILWSANFPLTTSTWPRTRRHYRALLTRRLRRDAQKVLWKNAANLSALD
jgi:predicted TIM-barrel fold metal-dependent hydrolase